MARTEQTKIEVLLDGRQASDQLKDLSKSAAALRIELAKAYEANDAGKVAETEWELSKLDTRMKQLRKETVDVKAVLDNLSGATMSDLRQSITSVNARLNSKNIKRNSEEWTKLTEVKRTLITEQKRLRQEIAGTDSVISKSSNILNRHNVLLAMMAGIIIKVTAGLHSSLYAFNNFEDSVQGVSSLTGLTGESLDYLKQKATETGGATLEGGIRVRQSATNILDAYKMIGSQRPELLKNKEALHDVTTEAIILSEAARMDLQPASKALTNSLNQFNASANQSRRFINVLAAGSQAGAGDINYLSQAIEKSGTTANLMGLKFEQLVALIETAAPKFSEAAVAGNSIDKVLMEMKAKQIGYRDGVFDVNVALDELAGRFAKGELAANIFGKEHAKMVEVLVDGREEFSRYQETVSGTNKAIEQAAVNTDSNKAKMAQLKAQMESLRIELGQKLTPILGGFTQASIYGLKALTPLVGMIGKYKITVSLLTAVLAKLIFNEKIQHGIELLRNVVGKNSIIVGQAKILGMNAQIAAIKLQALTTGSATIAEKRHIVAIQQKIAAMKTANATLAKTPWGLLAVGASMAVTLIIDLAKNTNKLSESQKRLNEIDQQYTDSLRNQTGQMEMLMVQIKKTNPGTEERIKLVDRLSELMPDIVDKQKLYAASLKDLKKYETDYRIELEKRIRLQANEAKYTALVQQQMEIEEALIKKRESLEEARKAYENTQGTEAGDANAQYISGYKNDIKKLERQLQMINTLKDKINITSEELPGIISPFEFTSTINFDSSEWENEIEKEINSEIEKSERLEKQHQINLENQQKYREEILFQSKSVLEQEDILNDERLKKAGLSGVKMEDLQKKEQEALAKGNKKEVTILREKMGTLEALQKTYRANLIRIKAETEKKQQEQVNKAIDQELQIKKSGYERELSELHIRQNEELANESLNAEERKKLKEKHQKEEQDMAIRQTKDLISTMQDILGRTKIDGIDLAGNIFTPEEKEKLEAKILKAREALSKLQAEKPGKTDTDQPKSLPKSEVDILGMTPDMWGTFFKNLEDGKFGIEEMQAAANALMNVWGTVNDFMAAKEKKQLKQYEKNTQKKKAALDRQLDAGKISQEQYNARVSQLDAELDAKKAEIENKQAKRQKEMSIAEAFINTAVGITCALKTEPVWLGIALAAVVGAMGAAQVATIAATPLPGAESGGYIDVVRDQDGKYFKAKYDPDRRGYVDQPTVITGESGREFVANAAAVANPTVGPLLDVIDAAQKSGTIERLDLTRYLVPQTIPGRASGGHISNIPSQPVITEIASPSLDPEMKYLLQENIRMMQILASKKIEIPWYGRGGIAEKMKKAAKYEQKITY